MEEPLKLIFFDTFSHESSEEINLDLVQFPKPVFIGEVRIIPLGARVQADFPGGVRLGATNPSQFKIEFFVNDLSKPGASTFENLGAIDYNQNGNIHFEYDHSRRPIPTDGLVLRGWYTTITLAVYGVLTKTTPPEPSQPDMVSSVDWLQQQMEDGTRDIMVEGGHHYASYPQDEDAYSGQDYRSQSYVWHQESYETPKESYEGENWEVRQEEKHWERNKERHQENFRYERREERSPEYERTPEYDGRDYKNRRWNEWNRKRPHTPPPPSSRETSPQQGQFESLSPGDVESISEGDIPETEGVEESGKSPSTPPAQSSPQQKTGEPFEPILSDDEIVDDQDMEYDFSEFTEDPLQSFNPYNNQIPLLKSFMDPSITIYEWETSSVLRTTDEDGEALKNLINSISNLHENKGIWVETAEQVISCISKCLPKVATDERQDILDKLISWVAFGLNFQEAYDQPQPGLKLRHIKAGIRLVETLSNCGQDIAMKMINESDAQNKLLNLYHEDHMALVIKLMILRSLDATLRYQKCVETFIKSYDRLLNMIQANQHARVKYALCALIQKIHFYDLLKNLDKQDESFLSLSMEEILKIFINAPKILSHPKRFLPVVQFEIINDFDPYKAIYSYFRHFNLIQIFIKLFSEHIKVVAPINGLISELLDSDDGLKFLASSPEINSLIQLLLGSSKNEGINPTLGLHLAYRLQALNYLDSINNIKIDADKPEIIDNIQGLFNLTLSNIGNIGKSSVVHVLSQGTNIEILINILKTKINKKRSPSRGYITDLISLTVKFTSHIPFLQKYAETLTQLCAEFTELEIQNWLPNENQYEIIKNHENCCSLPPELITAIKIIKYSSIPKHETDLFNNFKSDFTELKYKFNILQLYSNDGLSHLTSILSKLNKHYDQPYLHSSRFIARHGLLLLSLVLPSVQLIRRMITYVINVRNTDFKDLTVVTVFLRTYALMQAIPLNAQAHNDAVRVCREIIETFLAFTQPVEMSENEMNKSLWTAMVSEVVNFASEVPSNFMPGLMVLSELLPLPLPIQAESEDEIFVNMRRLWSAHLLSLSSNIETMISTMSSSSCYPLLQLLRRVCIQLSDLAAPTALLVVKSIIEAIDAEKNPIQVGRQINFIASLMNHGVIKIAFIHSLNEKNVANFTKCFESKNSHIQEGLSSICHSIFDTEIFLVPPPPSSSAETFLSCAIPPKEVIISILSSMINCLNDATFTTSLTVIRSLILLTEHDYGFFHLKNILEKQSENLMALIARIEKFVKENCSCGKVEWSTEKQECLALLSSLLELFRNLLNPEEAEYHLRNHKMDISELGTLLNWPSEDHPLSVIEEILKKVEDDGQQGIEQILSSLSAFFVKLNDPEKTVQKLEVPEPILPQPEPILTQFSLRMIFTNEREEDRLTAAYWLSAPNNDDPEQESDLVSVDLYEIARADLGVINLSEAIAQLYERKTETSEAQGQKAKVNVAKKPFVAPARGRGGIRGGNVRSSDTFRSRPPNTSRPPSLHVDDFVALETSGTSNYTKTVPQDKTRGRGRGRTFGMERGRFYSSHPYHREGELWERNQVYGNEMVEGVRFGRSQRPLLPWGSKDPRPQRGLNRHIRFFQS